LKAVSIAEAFVIILVGMVRPESLTRQNEIIGAQQYQYDDECLGYGYGLQESNMNPLNGVQE
jgi:hypothetical protein